MIGAGLSVDGHRAVAPLREGVASRVKGLHGVIRSLQSREGDASLVLHPRAAGAVGVEDGERMLVVARKDRGGRLREAGVRGGSRRTKARVGEGHLGARRIEAPHGVGVLLVSRLSRRAITGELEGATFEEVIYLLWNGKLPNKNELAALKRALAAERNLPHEVTTFLKSVPQGSPPMDVLRTAVSMLSLYDPLAADDSDEANVKKAAKLMARVATIVTSYDRVRNQKETPPA